MNAFSKSCGQGLFEGHLAGFNEDSAAMLALLGRDRGGGDADAREGGVIEREHAPISSAVASIPHRGPPLQSGEGERSANGARMTAEAKATSYPELSTCPAPAQQAPGQ